MKSGLVITGIIILIIGIATTSILQLYSSDCASGIGQLFQMFSPTHKQNCQNVEIILLGGYGMGFIGVVVMIWGIIAPSGLTDKNLSKYICGYCSFVAESERELHNHSLTCEKYQQEKGS